MRESINRKKSQDSRLPSFFSLRLDERKSWKERERENVGESFAPARKKCRPEILCNQLEPREGERAGFFFLPLAHTGMYVYIDTISVVKVSTVRQDVNEILRSFSIV